MVEKNYFVILLRPKYSDCKQSGKEKLNEYK
jgi:hypothetical protein